MFPLSPIESDLTSPSPIPYTQQKTSLILIVREGLMDWYLDRFWYRTCIWCKDKWMVLAQAETYFQVQIHLNAPPFLSAIFKPARQVFESGTKAVPLLGSGNRGCVIFTVFQRNVSAALSLLNKVCNSIYSTTVLP